MDDVDPYYDYTGYDGEFSGNPEIPDKSPETSAEEEGSNPSALDVFDPRRFFEIDIYEPPVSSSSSTYSSRSDIEPIAAFIHEAGRISIHPLGITKKPAGVSAAYWTSLDDGRNLAPVIEIDSLALDGIQTGAVSTVTEEEGAQDALSTSGSGSQDVAEEVPDPTEMPFLDHLEEFRWALLKTIFAVTVSIVASWFLTGIFYDTITRLAEDAELPLVYHTVMEPVLIKLQMALFMGLVIALPFSFYFLWSFISPGLYKREKKWILPIVIFATVSFLIGASIAYFLIVPLLLKLVSRFMDPDILPFLSIGKFISHMLKFTIIFGVIFEMPLVSYILAKIGIIKHTWMSRYRRYAIVVIFILGAVFTPPEPVSQIMMALPLVLLYEVSILVARIGGRKTLL